MTKPSQPAFDSLLPESTENNKVADARRAEARERLRQALQDPEFRAIEGFPIGTDEAILALSDLPYYTACPNPFLPEIIAEWQDERARLREELSLQDETYQRDPFAADVSEGKSDPIYKAHSYHTKVPHKAIMRYILHYTDPGDIVFDGFCGSGMTGVAAQLCGDRRAVEALGYRVDAEGVIWDGNKAISRLGARKAVLNDLSPAATFIAYNYNTPVDIAASEREARHILDEVERECGWMYETWHPHCDDPNRVKARINYTVWSDVFVCPECGEEMVYWDVAVDKKMGIVYDDWPCPGCQVKLCKSKKKGSKALRIEPAWETTIDLLEHQSIRQIKQVPVLINYKHGKKSFEKQPDADDIALIEKVKSLNNPYPFPKDRMAIGRESRRNDDKGITHVHMFYTARNLFVISALWSRCKRTDTKWLISSIMQRANKQHQIAISRIGTERKKEGGKTAGHRRGTLYLPSNQVEYSVTELFRERIRVAVKALKIINSNKGMQTVAAISTTDSAKTGLTDACIDYIFVDPPFGENIWYSELNFFWEAWLKVYTNNKDEAVVNSAQNKGLNEYTKLMYECFSEFYRILKPGRWITVEFHNSLNKVWNAIQDALQRAGFVVADVRILDKKKKTHTQVTARGSVDKDLVISAYKPNGLLVERFKLKAGTEEGVWEFVRYHLGKLHPLNQRDQFLIVNPERQPYLLFDRMVAFHIKHGVSLPISASQFYAGLEQRFIPRDGMYFLPEQVAEYDRAKLESEGVMQIPLLVTDEKTAIAWLRQQLDPQVGGPQTAAELNPMFKMALYQAKHELAPELSDLLQQNFLQDEEGRWYIPNPNRAEDLEKVRQRALLREFTEYVKGTGRLRQFRTEAVRAGFLDCLNRQDYATLLKVAKRLPEDVLRSDPDLLMYYDSAVLRSEDN